MAYYDVNEYVDMIRIYFENNQRGLVAAAAYQQAFPNRRHPDANVIVAAARRFHETGNVRPVNHGGRPRVVRNPAMEEAVIRHAVVDPRTSTRKIGRALRTSHVLVHKVLKAEKMHPYHFTRVQKLLPRDYAARQNFCRKIENRVANEPHFLRRILWTDECTFTQDGYFNFHNYHYYGAENPFLTWDGNAQYRFKLNVWAGLINNELIGPIFLPELLNGRNYLELIRDELPDILLPPDAIDDMPLIRRRIVFMHDGCPAHFAGPVKRYLNETYGVDWIGRGAPYWKWPPRSPDFNPCDFFLWGAIKESVYYDRIETVDELQDLIEGAFASVSREHVERATQAVARRVHACIENDGGQFQHLLN